MTEGIPDVQSTPVELDLDSMLESRRRGASDSTHDALLDDDALADNLSEADDALEEEEEDKQFDHMYPRTWLKLGTATLVMAVIAALIVVFVGGHASKPPVKSPWEESCRVFCFGPLLQAVQSAGLWSDSKTFVDMPLLADPEDVMQSFYATFGVAPQPSREELQAFVAQNFQPAGVDTQPWIPDDWQVAPEMLRRVRNDTLRHWALGLNDLWLQLGRQIASTVRDYPQRFTLLWQPHGMIVPGGRFLESYYWDTWWVVIGCLHSGMTRTAMGVTLNLVHLLETFGFVPNGGRTYYALPGRSQPPMLSSMVRSVFEATGNITFLARGYAALRTEYSFFMRSGEYGHAVSIAGAPGRSRSGAAPDAHLLNRYTSDQHLPRPESWAEDVYTAREAGFSIDDPGAQILFSEIAAAAESGWDFSARWFTDGESIAKASTSHVIPVDLNAIMYRLERDLAQFAATLALAAEQQLNASSGGGDDESSPQGGQASPRAAWNATAPDSRSDDGPAPLSFELWREGGAGDEGAKRREALLHYLCGTQSAGGGGTEAGGTAPVTAGASGRRVPTTPVQRGVPASALAQERCLTALPSQLRMESSEYAAAAEDRLEAMEALMWDEASGQWRDLRVAPTVPQHSEPVGSAAPTADLSRGRVPVGRVVAGYCRTRGDLQMGVNVAFSNVTSVSNWAPLWAGAYDAKNSSRIAAVRNALLRSQLLDVGGLAATTSRTGQQWDHPNGWAPSNHFVILGLLGTGETESIVLAREIARRWLGSGLVGYEQSGYMMEKYSVTEVGAGGGGGEYIPQLGFGFTNGAALDLLLRMDFSTLEAPAG